ncbi:MAG TPA: YcnI family protein [Actinoplanes sp.]
MNRSLLVRAGAVSATAAVLVLGLAGPAAAHVTVNPGTATKGGYTKVAFRVPTESDTASTTKVEVNLPTTTPIASVSVKPVPGWTAATVTSKLATPVKTDDGELSEAITKITWTASSGSEIKPGQFQEFDVSLGPLPDAEQVVFKALQTYSDGTVVRWIDEPTTDGTEPEKPAPVLKLAAATDPAAETSAAAAPAAAAEEADGDDGGSSGWGIAGLVVAIAALVLGLLAYRRAGETEA